MTGTSWRDWITVDPRADALPMMSDAELDDLGESIMENCELLVPLRFVVKCAFRDDLHLPSPGSSTWPAAVIKAIKEQKLFLLDGRNRLEAIERWLRCHGAQEEDCPTLEYFLRDIKICHLDSDGQIETQIVDLNFRRRHLEREQRKNLVAALLKANPEKSDRAIAKMAYADHKTVAGARREGERRGEFPHVSTTRIDSRGRIQPATKSPKIPSKADQLRALRERQVTTQSATPTPAPPQGPERHGVVDELEGILRTVRGDRTRLAMLSREKRVDIVKRLMSFLRIGVADLGPSGDVS